MCRRLLAPEFSAGLNRGFVGGQIQDVGNLGQIRAGRVLTTQDFSVGLGLTGLRGLWGFLGAYSDAVGTAADLANSGAVSFVSGITGIGSEAATFTGQTTSTLAGSNTYKQTYGSWGFWFRCSRRGFFQYLLAMHLDASNLAFDTAITDTNNLQFKVSNSGSNANYWSISGSTDVCDSRWHFATFTWDGQNIGIYLDGRIEALGAAATGSPLYGPMFLPASAQFTVGGRALDLANYFGAMDELFVTNDVLDEDMHRFLYCAKVPHPIPGAFYVMPNIQRRKRVGSLLATDFTSLGLAQPLVGYNFNTGALTTDNFGSLGKTLANNGAAPEAPDIDGQKTGAVNFTGTSSQSLSAADTSLPAGTAAKSIGIIFKVLVGSATQTILEYGNTPGTNTIRLLAMASGAAGGFLNAVDCATGMVQSYHLDGKWHFVVYVQDNSPNDGGRHKLYADGLLVGSNSASVTGPTLAGLNRFRIGSSVIPDQYLTGQVACAFICGYALTPEQVRALYNKSGVAMLGSRSPIDYGPFIERIDDTSIYCTFDELNGTDIVELVVAS